MASTTFFTTENKPGIARRVLRRISDGAVRYLELQSRAGQLQRLQSMSDAELARIGLRRDQIVGHVFRDRFLV